MDIDNFLEQLKEKLANENIAEDVEDLSLDKFSSFVLDETGNKVEASCDSNSYWTFLIPIIENIRSEYTTQIQDLTVKYDDLESRIANLEQQSGG